jgi:4-cresol dehydrogenase (hydroxylating)
MTVWLMPAPESFEAFFFLCKTEEGLATAIDALRPLRLDGTLRSVSHIGNDYKVVTATSRYPVDETNGRVPLDLATMARIRNRLGIGWWNGSGGLYGTPAQVREAKSRLRKALAGRVDRLQFLNDRRLRIIRRFATPIRLLVGINVTQTFRLLEPVYNLLKGVPSDAPLSSVYWRKISQDFEAPSVPHPDRDRCGLYWCSPVVPNTGTHALQATRLATRVLLDHGFEPQISVSLATERSLICVITISYDRDVPGEDDRARVCYNTLTEKLLTLGYPPYRLNVGSMGYLQGQSAYGDVLRSLKDALDPNGILAPGRYQPAALEAQLEQTAAPADAGVDEAAAVLGRAGKL